MSYFSNYDASNFTIRKPILKFNDIKLEIDYTDFYDIKTTFSYLIYLLTIAIFLPIDIIPIDFWWTKIYQSYENYCMFLDLILLFPKWKTQFLNAFSIYSSIIFICKLYLYMQKKNDNDKNYFYIYLLYRLSLYIII